MVLRHVIGDLQVSDERSVDGWCWMPERPAERIAIEILVDDAVVAQVDAALARPDVALPGMADDRHGFWVELPPGAVDRRADTLISARARDGGVVFGRRRLDAAPGAWEPRLAAVRAGLGALSERLAGLSPSPATGSCWGAACAGLGDTLAARAGRLDAGVIQVLARRTAAPRAMRLPQPAAPRASLMLTAAATAGETLARLRALAPAAVAMAAETILVNGGGDPVNALLPRQVAGLRLAASWTEAATLARGTWLLLLDDRPPSAAGLAALLDRLQGSDAVVAIPAQSDRGDPVLLDLPVGLSCAIRRDAWGRDAWSQGVSLPAVLAQHAGRSIICSMPTA